MTTGDDGRRQAMGGDDLRPPYGVAAIVSAVILGLYVATIAPTTQFWDTSEYIAAAKVLGIPHPPGNPLFVLLANVWGQIPLVGHYALRINLFAAVTSALSAGLLFLVADRFLRPVVAERRARHLVAFAGTLVGATAFTVWNQSVVNEKVYTVSLLSIALVFWLIVRWADTTDEARRDKLLLLVGYLLVLGSTNHLMGVLVGPAVAVFVLWSDWKQITRPWVIMLALAGMLAVTGWWTAVVDGSQAGRFAVLGAVLAVFVYAAIRDAGELLRPMLYTALVAAVVGISLNYIFLPLRAAMFPPINEGEPTTWAALIDVLAREQYQKPPLDQRMATFPAQIETYLQYFSWQFAHDWGQRARVVLALLFGTLGVVGAVVQWLRDRRAALAMTLFMLTVTIALVYYLNFRYGYSIRPGQELDREVRERDYFFVASFQLWGIWVAVGLGYLFSAARRVLNTRLAPTASTYAAAPVLLLALIPLFGNRLTAPRSDETLARDFAVDLLESLEPYAIVITAGDNDLFPLWYAQEVEGVRQDVVIANQSLMNTDWHLRQIIRREIFEFDIINAATPYREFLGDPPDYSPLALTLAGVDSLPLVFEVPSRSVFTAGELRATIEPGTYMRADLITLQLISENLGKRPVYFARTTGGTADRLGLTQHLVTEGMVRRLYETPPEASDDILFVQGIGWMDLERTETLLFDLYHHESAARYRPRGWIDRPSANILSLYYLTYGAYAELVGRIADSTNTERLRLAGIAQEQATRMLESLTP